MANIKSTSYAAYHILITQKEFSDVLGCGFDFLSVVLCPA